MSHKRVTNHCKNIKEDRVIRTLMKVIVFEPELKDWLGFEIQRWIQEED